MAKKQKSSRNPYSHPNDGKYPKTLKRFPIKK